MFRCYLWFVFIDYKEKKASKEKEREQRIAEAELENVHSARNVEAEKLKEILEAKSLSVKEVCWNVWCLFENVCFIW